MSARKHNDEVAIKVGRLQELMAKTGLDGILLQTSANFAWLTAGGNGFVARATDKAVGSILVMQDGSARLLTTNIEAPRLQKEEIEGCGLELEVVVTPWYEDRDAVLQKALRGKKVGSDLPCPGTQVMGKDIARLRYVLTPDEVARYRELGHATAVAIEAAAMQVKPGMTEFEIGALLDRELIRKEIFPTLTLVAVDERIQLYRHPICTSKVMQNMAMLVTCGRRGGLIASATRLVHLGPLSSDLAQRHEAVVNVDAAFYRASRSGALLKDVLAAGVQAYAEWGFADQWRFHHQGGPTGYENRDFVVNRRCEEILLSNQAVAWNPSIAGTKSEDTILVTANGIEVLTMGEGNWPLVEVNTGGCSLERPDILII